MRRFRRFAGFAAIFAALAVLLGVSVASAGSGTMYVGAWAGPDATGYVAANKTIGPLDVTKVFYGTLPATWAGSKSAAFPAGTVQVIAYNTPTTNVVSFAKSVPPGQIVYFSYQSEPEGAYSGASGASQFVTQWVEQANLVKSVGNPDLGTMTSAEAYEYQSGVNPAAVACDYTPPSSSVTAYGVDVYQHQGNGWPANGLSDYPRFQAWLHCVPAGARVAVTEYGVDATVSAAERNTRIQQDAAYLTKLDALLWVYWYGNMGTPGKSYAFTDAATVATWQSIEAGNVPVPTPTPTVTSPTPAPTTSPTPSTAPENIRVRVRCVKPSGRVIVWHWDFIGRGPGGDSPMRDSMNGKTLTFDGGCPGPGSVIIGP